MTWRDHPLPPVDNRARFVFGHTALQAIVADAMAAKSPELVFAPADVTFAVLGNGMIQTTSVGMSGQRPLITDDGEPARMAAHLDERCAAIRAERGKEG